MKVLAEVDYGEMLELLFDIGLPFIYRMKGPVIKPVLHQRV